MQMNALLPEETNGYKLLKLFAPDAHASLCNTFPKYQAFFQPDGQVLGDEMSSVRARAVGISACLLAAMGLCGQGLSKAEKSLSQHKTLILWSKMLTTFGSAGMLTSILAGFPDITKYVTGAITLASSLISVIADSQVHGIGSRPDIEPAYRALAEVSPKLIARYVEINTYLKSLNWDKALSPQVDKCIRDAGGLCGEVFKWCAQVGDVGLTAEFQNNLVSLIPDKMPMQDKPEISSEKKLIPKDV